jgi:hypothetical protein
MIVDRYDPVNLFELIPKLRLEMEPELAALDRLLEDDEIFLQLKADLSPSDAPTPRGSGAALRRWR